VPGVASSWETSPDGLVWIFHLRPGLRWSDGSPLTAGDFVWSFRRAVDPATASPYAEALYPIANAARLNAGSEQDATKLGVAAPDPLTLVVTLAQPTAYLAGVMSLPVCFPLPRRAIEAGGPDWAKPGRLVSNGAFTLASWTPQLEIMLARNPNYWDAGAVTLDKVRWVAVEDEQASLRAYLNGELDIAQVSPTDVRRLRVALPDQLHTDTTLRTDFLMVNTRIKPFDDPRLRAALSMAIDRDVLAGKVNVHGQMPANSLVPPGMAGYEPQPPDWAALDKTQRLARARALLAEAGFGPDHPLKVELSYPVSDTARLTLAALAAMWKPLGIDVALDAEENRVFNAAVRNHQMQIAYTDWIGDYPDPWTFLQLLDSRATLMNGGDYRSAEYDGLLQQAARTLDPAARMAALESAERVANRDAPLIPVAYETRPMLVSPKVRGYYGNLLDSNLSRDLSIMP
jgi:oligopeptide transport system substrate-binding protein